MKEEAIVLFDGVCNLCNGVVNLLIDLDKNDVFRFASLQSEIGKKKLEEYKLSSESLDSVLLIYKNSVYQKSNAVFEISSILGFPFSILKIFHFLPLSISNSVYDLVAKNRYRLFGKKDVCRIPTPELKNKFL
jgi:predicted DCC family thiol-disulfide oxidoreductase YuxK